MTVSEEEQNVKDHSSSLSECREKRPVGLVEVCKRDGRPDTHKQG